VSGELAGVRVVIVNNFPGAGLGGGEVLTLEIARGLMEAGAGVHAVVVPGSGFGARAAAQGVHVTETPQSPSQVLAAARVIAAQIAEAGPTVLFGTGYWTNLLVRIAARGTSACVVNLAAVVPGASVVDGGSMLGLAARRVADRATSRQPDLYIAVSGAVAAGLDADGAPAWRIRVIPNGVDIAALTASAAIAEDAPDLPTGRPLVVFAGRLEPIKGVETIVRAAQRLPDVTVAVVGDGPLAAELRELANELGVADRVAFLGRVPSVPPILAAADVVVLPSFSEGMPLVVLEALALARPVVASRVGGIPEVVEDGVTGLLVEPGDPEELAVAIERLVKDPALARSLAEAGARIARERYDVGIMRAAYVEAIATLVHDADGCAPRA